MRYQCFIRFGDKVKVVEIDEFRENMDLIFFSMILELEYQSNVPKNVFDIVFKGLIGLENVYSVNLS